MKYPSLKDRFEMIAKQQNPTPEMAAMETAFKKRLDDLEEENKRLNERIKELEAVAEEL